jgi:phytoene/squalene synthetase
MPNMQERLETAVSAAENDVSKFHNIITAIIRLWLRLRRQCSSIASKSRIPIRRLKQVLPVLLQAESARDAAVVAKNAANSSKQQLWQRQIMRVSETTRIILKLLQEIMPAANVAKINWLGNWAAGTYNARDVGL